MKRVTNWINTHRWISFAIYLVLVVVMLVFENGSWHFRYKVLQRMEEGYGALTLDTVPEQSIAALNRDLVDVPYLDTNPGDTSGKPPVILLHGTPGSSIGFNDLAPEFSTLGRRAIWLDMPGFAAMGGPRSHAFDDLSSATYAEYVFAVMDELGIERAHIVGWSNGGAVGWRMTEQLPDQVASFTMLAAVGSQKTEGSGSYVFEHTKYAIGNIACVWLPKIVPPFALIPLDERESFIRNFRDTDQRPMEEIMRTTNVPTLILHGRNDFLTSDWGAEYHHELIPTSTLIMTPHDHFMPMTEPEETAKHIENFIARHDEPGVEPLRQTIDLAPRRTPFGKLGSAFLGWVHFGPWYLHVLAVAGASLLLRKVGAAWVVVLVGATELDIGVAFVGLTVAEFARVMFARKTTSAFAWLGALARPGPALGVGFLLTQLLFRPIGLSLGELGWVLSTFIMAVVLYAGPKIFTLKGRRSIRTQWSRCCHHEWWPTWAIHGGALATLIFQSIKHRNPLVFTCCNPGITPGGGIGGESKIESLDGLLASGDDAVLFGLSIAAAGSPTQRANRALEMIQTDDRLGGFPTVLKPDRGEQGRGVMICNTEQDIRMYFEQITTDAIMQKFHAGPHEIGVFWVRDPEPDSGHAGRIFSIGRKEFSIITGDGNSTLEQLIHNHPRFRCQANIHTRKNANELGRVIPNGEQFVLSSAGNHSQGAIFWNAPDLITPELFARIDAIADSFSAPNGGGLDFGRFDIRYENEDDLKLGKNFGVVEVNGVTSESIDIYDPDRSVFYAWKQLQEQWKLAYDIGAHRRDQGAKPTGVVELVRCTLRHVSERPEQ